MIFVAKERYIVGLFDLIIIDWKNKKAMIINKIDIENINLTMLNIVVIGRINKSNH